MCVCVCVYIYNCKWLCLFHFLVNILLPFLLATYVDSCTYYINSELQLNSVFMHTLVCYSPPPPPHPLPQFNKCTVLIPISVPLMVSCLFRFGVSFLIPEIMYAFIAICVLAFCDHVVLKLKV